VGINKGSERACDRGSNPEPFLPKKRLRLTQKKGVHSYPIKRLAVNENENPRGAILFSLEAKTNSKSLKELTCLRSLQTKIPEACLVFKTRKGPAVKWGRTKDK